MRVHFGDNAVLAVLSRRNLLTLLSKLDREGSARTIVSGDDRLIVKAEEDDEHYQGREPGPMHPLDEEAIRAKPEQNYDY